LDAIGGRRCHGGGDTSAAGPHLKAIMSPEARAARRASLALAECLHQLASLIEATADADYTWRHPSGVSGSIGAHVRHCLDHVHAIIEGAGTHMTYDDRRRATRAEQDRDFAVGQLHQAVRALSRPGERIEQHVTLDVQVDRDGTYVSVASSYGRELAFVLQHTIHHKALIALLLADRGADVPETFALAPSTPLAPVVHADRVEDTALFACAR
jgi:uncharacterized damage-inducible protein DinB